MWTTGRMHGPRTTPPPPLHPAQWFNKTFLGVILSTSQEEMKQTGPQWREWELVKWSVTSFSIRWEHFPLRCLELPMVADGDGGGGPGTTGTLIDRSHNTPWWRGDIGTVGQCSDSQTMTHCHTARSKQTVLCQERRDTTRLSWENKLTRHSLRLTSSLNKHQ